MCKSSGKYQHVQRVERVDLSINPVDDPFRIDDEEYAVLNELYGNMVHWKAGHVVNRSRTFDLQEDVSQEIVMQVIYGASLYKRQKFVVGCMEWAMEHPEMIPVDCIPKFWASIYCYQVREKLGPCHGFKPQYEVYIAETMDAIDAPIDFEYSPLSQVFDLLRKHVDDETIRGTEHQELCRSILQQEQNVMSGQAPRKTLRHVRTAMIEAAPIQDTIFGQTPPKPCRYKPLDLDEHFKPYITQFIMNASRKSGKNIGRQERFNVGSLSLDENAGFLPDLSPGAMDFMGGNKTSVAISHLRYDSDQKSIRTFENAEEVARRAPVLSFAGFADDVNSFGQCTSDILQQAA